MRERRREGGIHLDQDRLTPRGVDRLRDGGRDPAAIDGDDHAVRRCILWQLLVPTHTYTPNFPSNNPRQSLPGTRSSALPYPTAPDEPALQATCQAGGKLRSQR